jgi:iron(III) transport system ATP-binding protein
LLKVKDLKKSYVTDRGPVQALREANFEVAKGEVFTLLGPSGCGKSTTLRCIAGLEMPDSGEIELAERTVFSSSDGTVVPTHDRGVGMVFQSYAIWPHMTVYENVVFPLRFGPRRVPKRDLRARVHRALRLVQMEEMADRPAPLLSGGQQQRVALARALVYEPAVLLLDEPLSNLDAKLRLEMRSELQALIRDLQVTALYVTHDQEEALALSDRIAVMQDGIIQQEGTPREIYMAPANSYVAGFVGRMNFFEGRVENGGQNGALRVALSFGEVAVASPAGAGALEPGRPVVVAIRPEDVVLPARRDARAANVFPATVSRLLFVGNRVQCELQVGSCRCEAEAEGRMSLRLQAAVEVEFPPERMSLFSI